MTLHASNNICKYNTKTHLKVIPTIFSLLWKLFPKLMLLLSSAFQNAQKRGCLSWFQMLSPFSPVQPSHTFMKY